MLPLRLTVKNFTCYEDETIDFTSVHIASLVGPNGIGKSSLPDGINIALFGEATKGGKDCLDNYVTRTNQAVDMLAGLEFLLHGEVYKVERIRNVPKNKTTLKLFRKDDGQWTDIGGKGLTETKQAIERLLRIDYKTFAASSLILQGKSDTLTADMNDTQRKEVLATILGLDIWDILKKKVNEQKSSLTRELTGIDQKRQSLQTCINGEAEWRNEKATAEQQLQHAVQAIAYSEAKLSQIEEQMKEQTVLEKELLQANQEKSHQQSLLKELQIKTRDSQDTIAHCVQKIKENENILSQKSAIESAVALQAELEAEITVIRKGNDEYRKAESELRNLESQSRFWETKNSSEITQYENLIKQAKAQSEVLDKVPCGQIQECPLLQNAFEARSKIDEYWSHIQRHVEAINPHIQLLQEMQSRMLTMHLQVKEQKDLEEALSRTKQQTALQPQLVTAVERTNALQERIHEAESTITAHTEKMCQIEAALKVLDAKRTENTTKIEKFYPLHQEVVSFKNALTQHRNDQALHTKTLGRLEAWKIQIDDAQKELAVIEATIGDKRQRLAVLECLDRACSKECGVPAFIIENAVPQIENLTNALLQRMTGGRFQVRLETQAAGKTTGRMQEVLRIIVIDHGIEGPYITFSGAEKFLIDLSLHLGISKFLAHRAGAEINFLVIDEGFGALEPANQQAVVEAIKIAGEDFGRVLVITHIEALQDAFGQKIAVSQNGAGSKVQVAA